MKKTWSLLWNDEKGKFLNSNNSEGAYSPEGQYTVWPLAVIAQAFVDSAKVYPPDSKKMVAVLKQIEVYYNDKWDACCASESFDGNDDVYYDDNAQVASAFITGYEATHDRHLLHTGKKIVDFLVGGWQDGSGGQASGAGDGGVRWHTQKPGCNTCTTAECALAALRLAKHEHMHKGRYVDFATKCCKWILENLQDPNDLLICDGLEEVKDQPGKYERNGAKWTYNQGTTLSLCSMLYDITKDDYFKKSAEGIAQGVTNRESEIFDRRPADHESRYYHDSVYFYQLLAEGFADFVEYLGKHSPPELVDRVKAEALHHMQYTYNYLKDPNDGLYYQTLELWKIDERSYENYKRLTGADHPYEPSGGEREHNDDIPVEQRKMAKSLIASGGAARIFFQTARLYPSFVAQSNN